MASQIVLLCLLLQYFVELFHFLVIMSVFLLHFQVSPTNCSTLQSDPKKGPRGIKNRSRDFGATIAFAINQSNPPREVSECNSNGAHSVSEVDGHVPWSRWSDVPNQCVTPGCGRDQRGLDRFGVRIGTKRIKICLVGDFFFLSLSHF